MAAFREIVSLDGVTLASLGAGVSGVAQTIDTDAADIEESYLRRPGATPLFVPGVLPPATVNCIFKYATYAELQGLLRLLEYPYNQTLRPLVAHGGDPNSTVARTMFVAIDKMQLLAGSIDVAFTTPEAVWRGASGTVVLGTFNPTTYANKAITNPGDVGIRGIATFGWSVQRTTDTISHGWKRRMIVSVTAGIEPLVRKTVFVNIGDTKTLVTAGDMRSDGKDIRVYLNGQEINRQLQNHNTLRTHVAFLADIPANTMAQYEIAWKNANAGTPLDLDNFDTGDPDGYSALDLGSDTGTSNGSSTSTVLQTPGKAYDINRWVGCYVVILSGTGAGQWRRILENTATTVTVSGTPFITVPNATSVYAIYASGFVLQGGRGNGGYSSTGMSDSLAVFVPNSLDGGTIRIIAGTGVGQSATITSNTTTAMTWSPAMGTVPDVTSQYTIEKHGFNRYFVERISHTERWRGLWKANKRFTKPSLVRFGAQGVPDAWTPDIYLDNRDDKSQVRIYSDAGVSNHYFPILRVVRQRNSDQKLAEKNQADGVRISDARGFDAIKFDYHMRNDNGVGRFVFAGRESGGEDWEPIFQNAATVASLALQSTQDIDLSAYGLPTHLMMAAIPQDSVEIPGTASLNDEITLESGKILELFVNTASWTPPVITDAAHNVYDMGAWMRLGGGNSAVPPYERAEIGGAGHRIFLKSGEEIWVDGERGEVALYSAGVYVKDVPWAAVITRYELDDHGVLTSFPSRDFMRLPGGTTSIYVNEDAMGTLDIDYVGQAAYLS